MSGTILIYGATGYTGKLIAKVAADQGAQPILAGRDLEKVQAIAKPLGLASRAFDLRDPQRIDAAIKDVAVVLCVAGPFSATSKPMANACLRNRVHYLDITGEIDVFETLAARERGRPARWPDLMEAARFRVTRVVLAAAHLDGDPTGSSRERFARQGVGYDRLDGLPDSQTIGRGGSGRGAQPQGAREAACAADLRRGEGGEADRLGVLRSSRGFRALEPAVVGGEGRGAADRRSRQRQHDWPCFKKTVPACGFLWG